MLNSKLPPLKAIILTALPVERQAVCTHLLNLTDTTHKGTAYWQGIFPCGVYTWNVNVFEVGAGNSSAALETERAISHLDPHVALFVGVAGGIKDVEIGDVVAATEAFNYESGKAGRAFLSRPKASISTHRMVNIAKIVVAQKAWHKRLRESVSVMEPQAYLAPIVAGEKVVSDTNSPIYKFMKKNYGHTFAVEMEGYGFLNTTHANPRVDALVIRGISDLINNKSESDAANSQDIASRHASAFAFEILAKLTENKEFITERENTDLVGREKKEKPLRSKYTINNSGQMAAGDDAHMTINWYKRPEE